MESQVPATKDMQTVLVKRVRDYFIKHNKSIRDVPELYFKALFFLFFGATSYIYLIFSTSDILHHLGAAIFLSIMISGIAMNILHDANHYAFSKYKFVNKFFSYSSDLIGVSSFLWRCFHNKIHHQHPNVMGKDQDLELSHLLRCAPHKKKYSFHRYQIFYMWMLFAVGLIIKPFRDFGNLNFKRKQDPLFTIKNKLNIVIFMFLKLLFIFLAFILPAFYYSIYTVIIFYMLIYGLVGIILVPIFHVGHLNEKTKFYLPSEISGKSNALRYQIESTSNFSIHNSILNWYLGGLNFQIEHHLFPYICHVHYPALSQIVKKTCAEYEIDYHIYPSFSHALTSHCQLLKSLGT